MTTTSIKHFNGAAFFEFTVTDNGTPPLSASARVDINVLPVNDFPMAANGFVTTQASQTVTIDLLDFASDVETSGADLNFAVFGCCDGEVTLSSDGHTMTVTPDAGFTGQIDIWYRVVDSEGAEDWGLIRIDFAEPFATDAVFSDWGSPLA